MRGARQSIALLLAGLLLAQGSPAQGLPTSGKDLQCPDANVFGAKLISGICWSCMFPVYLAGIEMFDGRSGRPPGANTDRLCHCPGDWDTGQMPTLGFSVGMYIPSRIIESVRKPWCFPTLFGADMGDATIMDGALNLGGSGRGKNSMDHEARGQYTWHFYAFPLLQILELLDLPQCNVDNYSTFDVMFMSEAFPNWYDEELGFLIHPEALIFGNPIAQAAQIGDCTAASLPGGGPLDEVFWSAGCWGSMYPISGKIGTASEPAAASLAATRGMYLISRLGFLRRTVGDDAMCGGAAMPVLRKSQYRMQQIFPVPESNDANPGDNPPPPEINLADAGEPPTFAETDLDPAATKVPDIEMNNVLGGCCHNMGENTMLWGEWRTRAATGEDFVYVLWRWTDCCAGILGPGGI